MKLGRIRQIVGGTFWLIVGLGVALLMFVQVPSVQRWAAGEVAQFVATKLGTRVSVGRVGLGLSGHLVIDDVHVDDQHQRRLLAASRVSASLRLLPLLQGQVSVSSAQVFGLDARLRVDSAGGKTNFQFVLDSLSGSPDTPKRPLNLEIGSLVIRRGNVTYDQTYTPETPGRFNLAHLHLADVSAHVMLNRLTDDSLNLRLRRLSLREKSGMELRGLQFMLVANRQQATFDELRAQLGESQLSIPSLRLSYAMADGQFQPASLQFYCDVDTASLALRDFAFLQPHLAHEDFNREPILLHASLSGTPSSARIHFLQASTPSGAFHLQADGSLANLSSTPRWFARVARLEASEQVLRCLNGLPGLSPVNGQASPVLSFVGRLGSISFRGEAGGNGGDVSMKGMLRTGVGDTNLALGLSDGHLTGALETQGLNLQSLLADNRFGQFSAKVDFSGLVANVREPEVTARGVVTRFDFQGYSYRNLSLDGQYHAKALDGHFSIDDTNGFAEMRGRLDWSGQLPTADLTATLSHFAPAAMQLTNKLPQTTIDAKVEAHVAGADLAHAQGEVRLTDFALHSPEWNYQLHSLSLTAGNADHHHFWQLDSDFAKATLQGDVDIASLPQALLIVAGHYVPMVKTLSNKVQSSSSDIFNLHATVTDAEILKQFLNVDLQLHEPLRIDASVNPQAHRADIDVVAPSLTYDGNRFNRLALHLSAPETSDSLCLNVAVDKVQTNGQPLSLSLLASAADNHVSTALLFDNNNPTQQLAGSLRAQSHFDLGRANQPMVQVCVQPSVIRVGESQWQVEPSEIVYEPSRLDIDHFAIQNQRQHIIISGLATPLSQDSLTVDLQDVDVAYILDFVNFHSVEFCGRATGRANVSAAFGRPQAHADLSVSRFLFQGGEMGTLKAGVVWNNEQKRIDIDAYCVEDDKDGKSLTVNGFVEPSPGHIDLDIQAPQAPLGFLGKVLNSFVGEVDLRGRGNVHIFGPLKNMNMEGQMAVTGNVELSSLGTCYTLVGDTVRLVPDSILFNHLVFSDRNGHRGTMNGAVTHNCLKNFGFNLDIDANNVLCYDFPPPTDGGTIYGTVYATGNCQIRGKSGETVIDLNATPMPGTLFVYNAASPDAITKQEFIHWGGTSELPGQGKAGDADVFKGINLPSDLHLNFLINATPEATLRLIMDQQSGDYIDLNGSGVLRATHFNKGGFQMFGNYLVDHGIYKLTIQNLLRREFLFQQGGQITFGGDPFEAQLQLPAVYTVNGVPLSDLQIGRSFTSNNIKVNCLMNITGTAGAPRVDFNLEMPTVSAEAQQMVRSVINSEEELNQQVIYLLSIGRFYVPQANNAEQQTSQTSLAMQSILSGTISQQLNTLLGAVVNNQNWNFGANISTGDEGWNNAEYEGLLEGRLLNNRLLINGQFGYRDNDNATTSFIGDFDIRYLLLPNGNLAIKVYNQTNDRYFTRNSLNTQGVGLIMKKDFNRLGELFGRSRKKKSKLVE